MSDAETIVGADAVSLTQWLIAVGSLGSALVALSLGFGLKEWIFRPRLNLLIRHRSGADEISDRVVAQRLETGEAAAFFRLRVDNSGRSTARNVGVRVLQLHEWDEEGGAWRRVRPELDGRLLQPSNQLPSEPDMVDVYPYSDRIIDLASVGCEPQANGESPLAVEVGHPWPPSRANILVAGTWMLQLLVSGDNVKAERYFVTLSFDGTRLEPENSEIWRHFVVEGPTTSMPEKKDAARL